MTARNVLLITVDQWRGDCLGVGGHPVVRTPAIDALAARGVRFANHWSVTAPCGPSRASLHTGLYPMNHRSVANGTPLDDRLTNIAREARAVGYDPTLFGYTDASADPRTIADPQDPRLFTYEGVLPGFSEGTVMGGLPGSPWLPWLAGQGVDVPADPDELFEPIPGYPGAGDHGSTWAPCRFPAECTETAFLTGEVIDWLDHQPGSSPWFAHVSYLRPHPPYRAPEGYHDRYSPDEGPAFRRHADRDVELAMHPLIALAAQITGCPLDERDARQLRATYWGNMAEVDDQLARLFAALEAHGLTDDTLVVLTSDHGEQAGDHWLVQKLGWWDESYHIPLVVVDPRPEADATRGSVVEQVTESVDVMPTLCTWLGAEVPIAVDGRELQPFLHPGPDGVVAVPEHWRTEAHWQWDFGDPVHHLAEDFFGYTMEQCTLDVVRGAHHKYVHFGTGDTLFFDLDDDPDQLVDRAGDPAVASRRADAAGSLLSWRMRHMDRTVTGTRLTKRGVVTRRDPRR